MDNSFLFQGTLTLNQDKSFLYFPFDVPAGTGALRLRLEFAPLRVGRHKNLITLGLYGPDGFRGEAHRGQPDAEVLVSATSATPGFIPGPLAPGRWQAQLAAHCILPVPEPCGYTLRVELVTVGQSSFLPPCPAPRVAPDKEQDKVTLQPGWYRGELHAHSVHSDGGLTVAELVAEAKKRGLDFFTLSDHNTVTGWDELLDAADGLAVLPAMEFTTFYGHALALGIDRWLDWRVGNNGWRMTDAARATRETGGLFVIAHPMNVGSPICTGCHWDDPCVDLAFVDGVEIWNGAWEHIDTHNPDSLAWWQSLLAQGRAPIATAGCDVHSAKDWRPGAPSTFVYAHELSTAAILAGLRQRRVVVSRGPWLELSVIGDDGESLAGIGDTFATDASTFYLRALWQDAPTGACLRWMRDNVVLAEQKVQGEGKLTLRFNVGRGGQFHAALWDADGSLCALTNPITVAR